MPWICSSRWGQPRPSLGCSKAHSDAGVPAALFEHIDVALPRFGAALIEPAAAFLTRCTREPTRVVDVCHCLVATGVRDPRILEILVGALAMTKQVAGPIAAYGDPGALPALRSALETFDVEIDRPIELSEINLLKQAFEELGGVLGHELERRTALWQLRDKAAWLAYLRAGRELGYAPYLADPATAEVIRRHLPPIEIVRYAEPVLEQEFDDPLDGLEFAYACQRVASMSSRMRRVAAIALLGRPSLTRKMIARYQEMFPEGLRTQ